MTDGIECKFVADVVSDSLQTSIVFQTRKLYSVKKFVTFYNHIAVLTQKVCRDFRNRFCNLSGQYNGSYIINMRKNIYHSK
jgi:CRISPR/Cas system-associated protein Csm6